MSRNRLIIGKEMGQVGKTMSQYIGNVANVNLYTGFFKPDLLKVSQSKHFKRLALKLIYSRSTFGR